MNKGVNEYFPSKIISTNQIIEFDPAVSIQNIVEKYLDRLPIMTIKEREVLIELIHGLIPPIFKVKTGGKHE